MTNYLMEVAKDMESYRLNPEKSEMKFTTKQFCRFFSFLNANYQDGKITGEELNKISKIAFGKDMDYYKSVIKDIGRVLEEAEIRNILQESDAVIKLQDKIRDMSVSVKAAQDAVFNALWDNEIDYDDYWKFQHAISEVKVDRRA